MANCKNCGAELTGDGSFCATCGANLGGVAPAPTQGGGGGGSFGGGGGGVPLSKLEREVKELELKAKKEELEKSYNDKNKKERSMRSQQSAAFFGAGGESATPKDVMTSPFMMLMLYLVAYICTAVLPFFIGGIALIPGLFFLAIAIIFSLWKKAPQYNYLAGAIVGAIISAGYLGGIIPAGIDLLVGLFVTVGSASFMQMVTLYKKDQPDKVMLLIFGLAIVIIANVMVMIKAGLGYWIIPIISFAVFFSGAFIGFPSDHPLGNKFLKIIPALFMVGSLIFYGLSYAITLGGAAFGGAVDQFMYSQSSSASGGSGTVFDMILNPKMALAQQLKPPSTREATKSDVQPTISYTTSAIATPSKGCYEHSTFTIVGSIRNTGTTYIEQMDFEISMDDSRANPKVCQQNSILESLKRPDKTDTGFCKWDTTEIEIAPGSTKSGLTCTIGAVPLPPQGDEEVEWLSFWAKVPCWPSCTTGSVEGKEIIPAHSCFFNLIAKTGFHSRSRLAIEIIEDEYAKDKLLQKQLKTSVAPSIASVGPIELSMGGFEQPIMDSNRGTTLITSIINEGNGEISEYKSVYLLIPSLLLNDNSCLSTDWRCYPYADWTNDYLAVPDYDFSGLDGEYKYRASGLHTFYNEDRIGAFNYKYDSSLSDQVLINDYTICFYNKTLSKQFLLQTATCNLKLPDLDQFAGGGVKELRRTYIIRGDVLYTYEVKGVTSVQVRDCTI